MSFESRALRLEQARGAAAGDMTVVVAADFLRGGEPTFARAFDRRGALVFATQRLSGEASEAFKARAAVEAGRTTGACRLLLGGLPDGDIVNRAGDGGEYKNAIDEPTRGAVVLEVTALHPSQIEALELIRAHRRVALVAGRRWGKTLMLAMLAIDGALASASSARPINS